MALGLLEFEDIDLRSGMGLIHEHMRFSSRASDNDLYINTDQYIGLQASIWRSLEALLTAQYFLEYCVLNANFLRVPRRIGYRTVVYTQWNFVQL